MRSGPGSVPTAVRITHATHPGTTAGFAPEEVPARERMHGCRPDQRPTDALPVGPPWVRWRLLSLESRMESWEQGRTLGSRPRVGTARRRRPLRCGWYARCVPRRSNGWRTSWVTGLSRCACVVKQAEIDAGEILGVSTAESERVKALEREVRELRRANEILKRAASSLGRSSTASTSDRGLHR